MRGRRTIAARIAAFSSIEWVLVTMLAACSSGQTGQQTPWVDATVHEDLPYVSSPDDDSRFHTLDLYLPTSAENAALVVFVHGGGWRAGDKSMDGRVNLVDAFLERGIGVASVNYRLSPDVTHPSHVEDIARAFAWIHEHGGEYGIDPDRVFIAGHSAGAHLVSLLALDPTYLARHDLSPAAIRGVISISGLYDLPNLPQLGPEPPGFHQVFGSERAELVEASPALKVPLAGPDTPPFQISYASEDLYGLAEQAKTFYSLLLNHRLPAQLVKVPARDHSSIVSDIGQSVQVHQSNGSPLNTVPDMLGPAVIRFISGVLDGSFERSFYAVWPEGGPGAVPDLASAGARQILDIQYYDGPGADSYENSLNLFVPEGAVDVPLLFQVHGGGWRVGDKSSSTNTLVRLFGRLGWAVASINYRLSPDVKHPTHIQDVARSFAWVYENAERHGIDRDRIVIIGPSAGAHLVSLLALDRRHLDEQGVPPDAIKGVIATSGVYDMVGFKEPGKVPMRLDDAFNLDPELLGDASSIRYVSADAPPFLLTHTDQDLFMLSEQAHAFRLALEAQGVPVRALVAPDRNHFTYGPGIGQPAFVIVEDVLAVEIVQFASDIVGPTPAILEAERAARRP